MPTYRIKDPTTGQVVKLTGDSPPTEQELEEVFAKIGGMAPAAASPPDKIQLPESAPPPPSQGIIQDTMNQWTAPLPTRSPLEGKWWTENLPQSLGRIVPQLVVGAVAVPYNAAKKFTDPVYNALAGKQDLGSAASDLFYAPRDAGQELWNGLARTTAAPTGLMGMEEAKRAWSDPAAAALAVAPAGAALLKGGRAMLPGPTEAGLTNQLGKTVATGFDKGVRPTGAPKTRHMLLEEQRLQQEAVKSIVNGKEFLKYKDEFGDPVIGQVPRNLDEFSQAIAQRKTSIITEANEMNKAAGKAGVEVDLNPVREKLQEIIDNPVLQDNAPQAVRYAQQRLDSYAERGKYTPEEAQEAMAILNRAVEVAKKTPTLDTISAAQVDALIANNMRELLNDAVEGATGPGYAALRREYGALKSIEAPVNKKLKQDRQRAEASALNFYDVFSASDLLGGILGGNVISAGKGLGLAAMAQKLRLAKDPNRAVQKMFEKSEDIVGRLNKLSSENSNPLEQ